MSTSVKKNDGCPGQATNYCSVCEEKKLKPTNKWVLSGFSFVEDVGNSPSISLIYVT
jgi:hypothetical protein